ncbi:hypothetical protein [Petrotoga sp. 9PW.55.5.1]|nr:hypothetical protein [Petrotoga sp. 9PW.55.5.1]
MTNEIISVKIKNSVFRERFTKKPIIAENGKIGFLFSIDIFKLNGGNFLI